MKQKHRVQQQFWSNNLLIFFSSNIDKLYTADILMLDSIVLKFSSYTKKDTGRGQKKKWKHLGK